MKRSQIFLAAMILTLASLACGVTSGGNNANATTLPTPSSGAQTVTTDFPLTPDAFNVTDLGDGNILYYTKLSLAEIMKFYRDAYTARGYKEREASTTTSDTTLNMIFDGDPSGKAVVIQSVDLGASGRTVSISLQAGN